MNTEAISTNGDVVDLPHGCAVVITPDTERTIASGRVCAQLVVFLCVINRIFATNDQYPAVLQPGRSMTAKVFLDHGAGTRPCPSPRVINLCRLIRSESAGHYYLSIG